MSMQIEGEDIKEMVDSLNFKEKVERSLTLIDEAYKNTAIHWWLQTASARTRLLSGIWQKGKSDIRGFIVTTRFKPPETIQFMHRLASHYPELKIYKNDISIQEGLYEFDPDKCCELLKVAPTRMAIEEMNVSCWVTGLRCTEGRTRTDFKEIEERDEDLIKLNPILLWKEREVWQYLALYTWR